MLDNGYDAVIMIDNPEDSIAVQRLLQERGIYFCSGSKEVELTPLFSVSIFFRHFSWWQRIFFPFIMFKKNRYCFQTRDYELGKYLDELVGGGDKVNPYTNRPFSYIVRSTDFIADPSILPSEILNKGGQIPTTGMREWGD